MFNSLAQLYVVPKYSLKTKTKTYKMHGGNMSNIDENYINKIHELYQGSFITVPNDETQKYNFTYGELTNEGMKSISDYLNSVNHRKTKFFDLGCGNGRTLAYAIAHGFDTSYGVEIVPERYEFGLKAITSLTEHYPSLSSKITIKKDDILTHINPTIFSDNNIVFISNLLFPDNVNVQILRLLREHAHKDTLIMLSKVPSNFSANLVTVINAPMSWASNSKLYILDNK